MSGVSKPGLLAECLGLAGIKAETGAEIAGTAVRASIVATAAIGARSTPTMLRGESLEKEYEHSIKLLMNLGQQEFRFPTLFLRLSL